MLPQAWEQSGVPILQTLEHFKRAVQLKVSERSDQESSSEVVTKDAASHLRVQLSKENETKVEKNRIRD